MPLKKSAKLTGNHRTAAIGFIVVCIVGTAILIAARSSEPTAAAVTAQTPAAPAPVKTAPVQPRATKPSAGAASTPQSGETAAKAAPEPATIEGCLVQDNETFRLKDTSGDSAPKGRSWKSGFLKKSNKTIELVDERHRLNLAGHVGERVSVAGMLDERELMGNSLKRIAETCE